jgi:hypothetical protein
MCGSSLRGCDLLVVAGGVCDRRGRFSEGAVGGRGRRVLAGREAGAGGGRAGAERRRVGAEAGRVLLGLETQRGDAGAHGRARLGAAVHVGRRAGAVRTLRRRRTQTGAHGGRRRHQRRAAAAARSVEAVDAGHAVLRGRRQWRHRVEAPVEALGAQRARHLGPVVVRRVGRVQRVSVRERLHQTVELRAESVLEVGRRSCSRVHRVPLALAPLCPPVFEPHLKHSTHILLEKLSILWWTLKI